MSFRSAFIGLFGIVFFFAIAFLQNPALAQDPPPAGTADNPYRIGYTKDEFKAYNDAITETGCTTPSLECLVRNTTRFVAIEWVQEIMGPNMIVFESVADAGSSIPTEQIVAQGGQGVINGTFKMIGSMYSYRPATTSRYVAYVIDNADLAPPAYAQGIGFAALDPILDLWRMFRNVAYFFFIGIFIVIGFMIMFRQKISGSAPITAQQAIPSIIIALILVTFSYAIAGFLIDLMYLCMFAMLYLFNLALGDAGVTTGAISWNIFQLAGELIRGAAGGDGALRNVDFIGEMINTIFSSDGGALSNAFAWAGGLTVSLILAVAILIGMVKLFFELLKSYASIIMAVIFAPIYLMLGAIPGKNAFGPWFKNLVGNLAAFPTVLLFVMMYKIFTEELVDGNAGFMPPFLIGGGASGVATHLLGLAIILALPEIVKKIKETMGATEGGFGWMVANAATSRGMKSGVPIVGAGWGAVGGGLLGAGGGAVSGLLQSGTALRHGQWDIVGSNMLTGARVYGGNMIARGAKFGETVSTQAGGATPGFLRPVQTAVVKGAGYLHRDEQLKRKSTPDYLKTMPWETVQTMGMGDKIKDAADQDLQAQRIANIKQELFDLNKARPTAGGTALEDHQKKVQALNQELQGAQAALRSREK